MAVLNSKNLKEINILYYGQKLGAPQIARLFGVSVDAVYFFMKKNGLRRRSLDEENSVRFSRKPPSFKPKNKLSLNDKLLKVAGVMLYWAEGFQSERAKNVDFANSKPEMIFVFLQFLRRICGVDGEKLRGFLYCYSNQNPERLIHFWSMFTSIPKEQFSKPYIRHDFDIKKINKMPHGLLHIRYYDKKLLLLIRQWISEYIKCWGGGAVNRT